MKLPLLLLALLPAAAMAQDHPGHGSSQPHMMEGHAGDMEHGGGHGMMHGHGSGTPEGMATETGQAGFAAIAEIVALLAADPGTDWNKVDIGALRDHLRDMDLLVTELEAGEEPLPDGLRITVARDAPGAGAAWRMLPAHAPMLAAETGWNSTLEESPDRLVWTVTSPEDAARIRALGLYGLMASGAHHQAHHLAIARGAAPH